MACKVQSYSSGNSSYCRILF